jgi:hypothetical protein
MVEKWASQQALDAHAKGPNLAALGPKLAGKVTAAPEVIVLQPVPAGDPAKGAVIGACNIARVSTASG